MHKWTESLIPQSDTWGRIIGSSMFGRSAANFGNILRNFIKEKISNTPYY